MSNLLVAVWAQAGYVCAVHRFIQELLLSVALGLLKDRSYIRSDTEFKSKIERAIIEVSSPSATASDYVHAIVNTACREMEDVCRMLRYASALAGLERIASEYLDAKRFKEMLLRKDDEKLGRLVEIVRKKDGAPAKILMDVAKVLNDSAEIYDEMGAAAKRKAAAELKKVVENVTSIVTKAETWLGERIDDVGGKVDAVGKKVDRIQPRRKRKRKYTDVQAETCRAYWDVAQTNAEVKHAINTRITYESVFNYYTRQLAKIGVRTVETFKAIIHSSQNRECEDRKRELEARREAERKAAKHGIMRGMKFIMR